MTKEEFSKKLKEVVDAKVQKRLDEEIDKYFEDAENVNNDNKNGENKTPKTNEENKEEKNEEQFSLESFLKELENE